MQKYDREFKIIITKVPNYGKRAKHVPCENFHREKIVNMPDANLKAETYGNRMKKCTIVVQSQVEQKSEGSQI